MCDNWPQITASPELCADDLQVWSVPLDVAPARSADFLKVLAVDERERAARFRVEDARRRFVTARAGLRRLLGQYLHIPPADVAFDYDENDKPRLSSRGSTGELRFNLAHSGNLALVAVTRGCDVGVDVEQFRPVNHWREIAERYFHPREIEHISALPPTERIPAFMRCWTGKEAVLKALGVGITRPLDFFVGSVVSTHGTWIELLHSGHQVRCHLQPLLPGSEYAGAVACVGIERQPQCFALD